MTISVLPTAPRRPANGDSAFSLVEAILALILFASGSVAAMELFQRSQAAHADADQVVVAVGLAQRRFEELRNVSYASLANEAKASVSTPSGYATYSRAVTITTPDTNLKQVVVTIYWTAPGGETSVSLSTYRANL